MEIGRREPAPVGPLVALGGLVGLGLGWAGMRRAVRSRVLPPVSAGAVLVERRRSLPR
ncbi:hypothetical protein Daura_33620 [Dactylosporangium aurantiacum]|uniref:Uncharacterized protein n=1 Tax=Dactylosporangium aurantiacum TaxID=35754 RepID=A0A9Q9I8E7_9ACTN|nr:hypothetical protein [Dactylosporangium aurantiacum]MDG6105134.1 hypothetical protein [Dactylosporangium aurantiacum]UWZ51659.1 hypothetical protein Daura_33620 [Dactylosporangium aurantiacum]